MMHEDGENEDLIPRLRAASPRLPDALQYRVLSHCRARREFGNRRRLQWRWCITGIATGLIALQLVLIRYWDGQCAAMLNTPGAGDPVVAETISPDSWRDHEAMMAALTGTETIAAQANSPQEVEHGNGILPTGTPSPGNG